MGVVSLPLLIEVADENSQAIEIVLDNILFYIVLDWNESGKYWSMAVRNAAYATVVDGIALSPNWPLTWQFRYADMPPGELEVISAHFRNGPVPKDGFLSAKYSLVYHTVQELIDAGVWSQYRNVALAV